MALASVREAIDQSDVVIASDFGIETKLYHLSYYSFAEVLRETVGARVLAPAERYKNPRQELIFQSANYLRRALGLGFFSRAIHVDTGPAEFFFFVSNGPDGLREISAFEGWQRARLKAAFIIETWPRDHTVHARELETLKHFDHVFIFNPHAVPRYEADIGRPCSYLPGATDCLRWPPFPVDEPRTVDVYAMGRRAPGIHDQLLKMAIERRIHYSFDHLSRAQTVNPAVSRFHTVDQIRNARYFLVWGHNVAERALVTGGEEAIPTRYFEGIAGGAVMIGDVPNCDLFPIHFDWEDAVIPMSEREPDVAGFLERLDRDPERLRRIKIRNIANSLRKHDWIHRWKEILTTLGLPVDPRIEMRIAAMNRLADQAESHLLYPARG